MEKNGPATEATSERRDYFRVEDVLPISVKRVSADPDSIKCRVLTGLAPSGSYMINHDDLPEPGVSPKLWKLLKEINCKLDLILERLPSDNDHLCGTVNKHISISLSGMSFTCDEAFDVGTLLEIKVLMPVDHPKWVMLYGKVVRTRKCDNDQHEIGVRFEELDEDVKDIISFYTLKRQREIIRKQKEGSI